MNSSEGSIVRIELRSTLDAEAVLKEVKGKDSVTDEQIDRLKELFPKSKYLK